MATKTKRKVFAMYPVTNCCECPNVKVERTPGAGYAEDYFCKGSVVAGKPQKIVGYVEWSREGPQDHKFPDFCPLTKKRI